MTSGDVFTKQNYGHRLGFGQVLALLIVDFQVGFRDPALLGSSEIADAIQATHQLLQACRGAGLTIAYTRHVYSNDGSDRGLFCQKVPNQTILTEDHPSSQIVPELTPREGEIVVRKRTPSAFFGTTLDVLLRARGVDTVLVAGCSTSGCVHATVVDAMANEFRAIVVRECVGDRHGPSHEMALLNMDMKYGDVERLDEVRRRVRDYNAKRVA